MRSVRITGNDIRVLRLKVLNAVLETIVESVSAGKKVTFLGFGSFDRRARAARMGRNPKTGEVCVFP
jgi:DNA-binding protein HU-beta